MFLKYKIRKLQMEVDVQTELVRLRTVNDHYDRAHYHEDYIQATCKLLEMNLRLEHLKSKLGE